MKETKFYVERRLKEISEEQGYSILRHNKLCEEYLDIEVDRIECESEIKVLNDRLDTIKTKLLNNYKKQTIELDKQVKLYSEEHRLKVCLEEINNTECSDEENNNDR